MAVMLPDDPPLVDGRPDSENDFWWLLKEQLPDEFYVFHSLPYLTSEARQGEVDFLVVHRRLGFLNIECKGKGVQRAEDGRWYRLHSGSKKRERLSRSPSEQARHQIEDIVGELQGPARRKLDTRFGKFPLVYGWALAFPLTKKGELNLPASLKEEVVIDSDDLDDLEAKVRSAMGFYRRKMGHSSKLTLSEDEFDRFRSLLSPPVKMPPLLSAQIEQEGRQIERISERQAEILHKLMGIDRLRVTGGAGTGKTVMALKAAELLAAEGNDVWLTCFNASLTEFLRDCIDAWPPMNGSIKVGHFHEVGVEAGKECVGDFAFPDDNASRAEQSTFWSETVPFALMEALDDDSCSIGPWDAIIVDEAQDFAGDWWSILECGLRDGGQMAIFYDEAQRLFDHSAELPEWGAEIPLDENFRNTKAIARPVQKLGSVDVRPHEDCPEGEPPSVYQQQGPSKTRRQIGDLIDKLVDRQQLGYHNIAILSPHRPHNSALEAATELGGHTIVHDVEQWYDDEGVLHSTISSFKGLQAEVVILIDIDPDDKRCSKNARYVAASRAINRLHVFEKGHWLAE